MPVFFADSWFFIAVLNRRDAHYRSANRLYHALPSSMVVTHDAVLSEVLAYFSEEGPMLRQIAVDAVRLAIRTHDVIPVDRPLFLRALTRYEQRADKEYSLVDCMSMVIMEERDITHVLTNDHHFSQAGFTVVNQ